MNSHKYSKIEWSLVVDKLRIPFDSDATIEAVPYYGCSNYTNKYEYATFGK